MGDRTCAFQWRVILHFAFHVSQFFNFALACHAYTKMSIIYPCSLTVSLLMPTRALLAFWYVFGLDPPGAIDKADYASFPSMKIVTNLRLVQVALADALCCMPADRLNEIFPSSSIPIDSLLIRSICSSASSSSHILHQMRLHTLLARWQTKCLHVS